MLKAKYYKTSIDLLDIKASLAAQLAIKSMKTTEQLARQRDEQGTENWIEAVRAQVNSLRFGQVQIVVHDARVVQIEKTEKIRFEKTER